MARYAIRYACGHEDEVNLIGPARSRESRKAYLEQGDCFECYKQHAAERAREQASELELPALTGSENQVEWAESLRMQKFPELEAYVESHNQQEERYRHLLMVFEQISQKTAAQQWIEWRHAPAYQIISDVFEAMKSVPTAQQKQAEQEAAQKAAAIQRAALLEASIRPISTVTEVPVELQVQGTRISIFLPERREDFREIVRGLGYKWSYERAKWERTIGRREGTVQDRAIELGQTLLSHGFMLRVFDAELRAQIIAGNFKPEQTRWVVTGASGPYTGWFLIYWGAHEDYYEAARKIRKSKYSRPYVVAPPVQFEQVLDFAERYAFQLSVKAGELVDQARREKEQMIIASPSPPALPTGKQAVDVVPPVLVVPASVEIADELRED